MHRLERVAHFLVTYAWYPAALLGSVAVSFLLLQAGGSPGLVVAANGTLFAVLCLALEVAAPETPEWRLDGRELRADLLHAVITNTLPTALYRVLFYSVLVSASAWLSARVGAPLWPEAAPWPAQLALALVVVETANYGIHRFLHESRFWPLHAVHHSSQRMYFMIVVRKHPIQAFFTYGGRLSALWLLGAPGDILALYTAVSGANGFVQHSNVHMRTGPLSWILATPEIHRIHHSSRPEESGSNYADVLMLWDVLLGTRSGPDAQQRLYRGLGPGTPRPVEQSYWGHLKLPFVWRSLHAPEPAGSGPGDPR